MNKNELMAAMARNGDRQIDLANALGLSRTRLSAKINERNGAVFNQPEMKAIRVRYKLSDTEVCKIFLICKYLI